MMVPQSSTRVKEDDFLDYFHAYCENTIWFKKIASQQLNMPVISKKDVATEFLLERNRILALLLCTDRSMIRKKLNAIAKNYFTKIANWSEGQKIFTDMV